MIIIVMITIKVTIMSSTPPLIYLLWNSYIGTEKPFGQNIIDQFEFS